MAPYLDRIEAMRVRDGSFVFDRFNVTRSLL
jgi:hypothetical protein